MSHFLFAHGPAPRLLRSVLRPLKRLCSLRLGLVATCLALFCSPSWALKHVWAETLHGFWVDQADVVRLPNVSAQVSYYVIIQELNAVILAPAPFVATSVHAADRDDAHKRAAQSNTLLPTSLLPAFDGRGGIRIGVIGWIGGGMLKPEGRLDPFSSFMPQHMPVKVRWIFEKSIPQKFKGPSAQIVNNKTVEYDFPQTKIQDRSVAYLPFLLGADDPEQNAQVVVIINGHELKPLRLRFTGKPLKVPEYRPD